MEGSVLRWKKKLKFKLWYVLTVEAKKEVREAVSFSNGMWTVLYKFGFRIVLVS